jgi:hypothetical protein
MDRFYLGRLAHSNFGAQRDFKIGVASIAFVVTRRTIQATPKTALPQATRASCAAAPIMTAIKNMPAMNEEKGTRGGLS